MKRCTFFGSELYDFSTAPVEVLFLISITQCWSKIATVESCARTDPWRSVWLMKDQVKLFANNDRELSHDQKNILVWSSMYDNIQESMDCPTEDVINDDDLLDGWFIVQKRKRDEEKAKSEVDNMSPNASEPDWGTIMVNSCRVANNFA